MPSKKRSAKLPSHFNSTNKRRHHKRNPCPRCKEDKDVRSKFCWNCTLASTKTKVSNRVFYIEGEPCRLIGLTRDKAAIVDADMFKEINKYNWHTVMSGQGDFYAVRYKMSMHAKVMGDPKTNVDHKNHNTLDNRKSNLRTCTKQQNRWNSKKNRGSKSNYKGVHWEKRNPRRPWRANFRINGKLYDMGYYANEEDAARAYDTAIYAVVGEFAHLNFPNSNRNHHQQDS